MAVTSCRNFTIPGPQHRLAAVQRLCDTEAVQMTASDTTTDTGQRDARVAKSAVASLAIELSAVP